MKYKTVANSVFAFLTFRKFSFLLSFPLNVKNMKFSLSLTEHTAMMARSMEVYLHAFSSLLYIKESGQPHTSSDLPTGNSHQ
jgi:hypothetical protein